jgi:hypothetical protein
VLLGRIEQFDSELVVIDDRSEHESEDEARCGLRLAIAEVAQFAFEDDRRVPSGSPDIAEQVKCSYESFLIVYLAGGGLCHLLPAKPLMKSERR